MSNLNDRESYRREVYETDGQTSDRVVRTNHPDQVTRREVHETVEHNPRIVDRTTEPRYVAGDRDANPVVRPTGSNSTESSWVTPVENTTVRRGPFGRPIRRDVTVRQVDGRIDERQRIRDNDNAARGLMMGIILTSLAGLVIGTLFALSQRDRNPEPVTPVVIPNTPASPQVRERIIQRDRLVPAPQSQQNSNGGGVTVPSGSSSGQQAPAQTAPAQSGTQSSGTTNGTSGTAPSSNGTTSSGLNTGATGTGNTGTGVTGTGTNATSGTDTTGTGTSNTNTGTANTGTTNTGTNAGATNNTTTGTGQ